jgi:hypothetical protein
MAPASTGRGACPLGMHPSWPSKVPFEQSPNSSLVPHDVAIATVTEIASVSPPPRMHPRQPRVGEKGTIGSETMEAPRKFSGASPVLLDGQRLRLLPGGRHVPSRRAANRRAAAETWRGLTTSTSHPMSTNEPTDSTVPTSIPADGKIMRSPSPVADTVSDRLTDESVHDPRRQPDNDGEHDERAKLGDPKLEGY